MARHVPETFKVAFSLAGEERQLVEALAEEVERLLGPSTVFYDAWFEHYLAGPNADLKLQAIYRERSELAVVCISAAYGRKPWTRAEHQVVRARLMEAENSDAESERLRVLTVRVGEGEVEGIHFNQIAPDLRKKGTAGSAQLILDRLELITGRSADPHASRGKTPDLFDTAGIPEREPDHRESVARQNRPGEQARRSIVDDGRFSAISEPDRARTLLKFRFEERGVELDYSRALVLWASDSDFVDFFISTLRTSGFVSYAWETPPISNTLVERSFEFVLHNSPAPSGTPDRDVYAEYFDTGNANNGIVAFDNLGMDALLIVPSPYRSSANYSGLAEFHREAPAAQQVALWSEMARHAKTRLSDRPMWISVATGGIAWLHIRLDSNPKYYRYAEYTSV